MKHTACTILRSGAARTVGPIFPTHAAQFSFRTSGRVEEERRRKQSMCNANESCRRASREASLAHKGKEVIESKRCFAACSWTELRRQRDHSDANDDGDSNENHRLPVGVWVQESENLKRERYRSHHYSGLPVKASAVALMTATAVIVARLVASTLLKSCLRMI